jgi:glycosyltransferase involved in cell wall biosynthesis
MAEGALRAAGHEAIVMPFSEVRHRPSGIRHCAYLVRLLQAGRSEDFIYALDAASVGMPAMVAAFFLRKRLVVRIAGDFAWEQGVQRFGVKDTLDAFTARQSGYGMRVRILRALQTLVARRAQRIIVPSRYLKRVVAAWGVAPEKITVVYSAFAGAAESPPAYRSRPVHIVSAGRLVPWKGMRTLVRAFATVQTAHPEATLSIAGDGPQRAALEKDIAEAGLGGSVTLEGQLSSEALHELMRRARIFALNTGYEGFSHVLLEAMDAGMAVVTTPGCCGFLTTMCSASGCPGRRALRPLPAPGALRPGIRSSPRLLPYESSYVFNRREHIHPRRACAAAYGRVRGGA